ncbi:jg27051 [Pararge aegeria aegeria]|uniref:Jg27051 protein n=1 Tax=Pararge aegeria aegeria TaxID=348720 RepID=A0A8S4QMQ6_9NEOP|nr:jg27051 [Pararge aegeria aegeria]
MYNNKPEIKGTMQIDQNVEQITKHITTCYEKACPLRIQKTKHAPKHSWWGPDLERKRQRLRHLFNRAKNTRKDADWDKFKEAQSQYKKLVQQKTVKWQHFCTSIENYDNANRIRKILARDNIRTIGSLKKQDGNYIKNDKEVSETLIETHFPGCRPSSLRFIY